MNQEKIRLLLCKWFWRRDQLNLRYEKTDLEVNLEKKIFRIQSALGLNYGDYDFSYTR